MPGPFASKSFKATLPNSLAARYRKQLSKHPFLLFGLPFLTTIVAGSFMLTPATALRYERYDRKNQQITHEEAMGLKGDRRKANMKDEYYVRLIFDAECIVRTDKTVEATGKGLGELGAEASQTIARRDRWYTGIGRLSSVRALGLAFGLDYRSYVYNICILPALRRKSLSTNPPHLQISILLQS